MMCHSFAVNSRSPGLDLLRLLAALLIFVQHTLSSCHLDAWIDFAGFRVGRIGTSLFFMLAGYFAARSHRPAGLWFRDRLQTLFPPFWLVTILGFFVAAVTGYKPFDTYQVFCQLAGLGYLTHGERMVSVATWFMTPLLLLYTVALLSRLTRPLPASIFAMAVCGLLSVCRQDHWATVLCHAFTFESAFLVGTLAVTRQVRSACLASLVLICLTVVQPEHRYGALSLLAFAGFSPVKQALAAASRFAAVAYEWFLVHSLCILLVTSCTQAFWVALPLGAILSFLSACLLKKVVLQIRQQASHIACRFGTDTTEASVQSKRLPVTETAVPSAFEQQPFVSPTFDSAEFGSPQPESQVATHTASAPLATCL